MNLGTPPVGRPGKEPVSGEYQQEQAHKRKAVWLDSVPECMPTGEHGSMITDWYLVASRKTVFAATPRPCFRKPDFQGTKNLAFARADTIRHTREREEHQ